MDTISSTGNTAAKPASPTVSTSVGDITSSCTNTATGPPPSTSNTFASSEPTAPKSTPTRGPSWTGRSDASARLHRVAVPEVVLQHLRGGGRGDHAQRRGECAGRVRPSGREVQAGAERREILFASGGSTCWLHDCMTYLVPSAVVSSYTVRPLSK